MFDCDGTLLETESRWTLAERAICARWGVPFTMELKMRLLGTHIDRAGEILAEWVGEPVARAPVLADAFLTAYRDVIDGHGVDAMPGAHDLVAALAGRVPLAVASNTNIDDTRRVLARSPLPDDAFDAVVCAGDGVAPKPAPDVYVAACRALGVDPPDAVAFEDSPVGARSATAAGLYVYGVPFGGAELRAHRLLSSLTEIAAMDILGEPTTS